MPSRKRIWRFVKVDGGESEVELEPCVKMECRRVLVILFVLGLAIVKSTSAIASPLLETDYLDLTNEDDEISKSMEKVENGGESGDEEASMDQPKDLVEANESSRSEVSTMLSGGWSDGGKRKRPVETIEHASKEETKSPESHVSVINNQSISIEVDKLRVRPESVTLGESKDMIEVASSKSVTEAPIESQTNTTHVTDSDLRQIRGIRADKNQPKDQASLRLEAQAEFLKQHEDHHQLRRVSLDNSQGIKSQNKSTKYQAKREQAKGKATISETNQTSNRNEMRAHESSIVETTEFNPTTTMSPDDLQGDEEDGPAVGETPKMRLDSAEIGSNNKEEPRATGETSSQSLNDTQFYKDTSKRLRDYETINTRPIGENLRPDTRSNVWRPNLDTRELLVGPFRSESEAPDTITLAGVVYQKSGSSSQIHASHINNRPTQLTTASSSLEASVSEGRVYGHQNNLGQLQNPVDKPKVKLDITQLLGNSQHKVSPWLSGSANSHQVYMPVSQAQLSKLINQSSSQTMKSSQINKYRGSKISESHTQPNVTVTVTSIPPSLSLLTLLADFVSGSDEKKNLPYPLHMDNVGLESESNGISSHDFDWKPSSMTASSTTKKEIEPNNYSALLQNAASELSSSHTNRVKEFKPNSNVVVVEKSVKPVKYHLLKAYLKLRHLLRPVDATFVFPASTGLQASDVNGIVNREGKKSQ